jgi:pyruvate kinase
MLDSMMKNPRPTRAETTDVANAIYDGTTAIMLSGESAAGAYPVESVNTMNRIALRAEQDIGYDSRFRKRDRLWQDNEDISMAISHACCTTAMDLNAKAIITVTMSGTTAATISKFQPGRVIIGCTVDEVVYRQMSLFFGVQPLLIEKQDDAEKLFDEAIKASLEAGLIEKGDRVVLTAGVPLGISGKTNTIRAVEV